MAPLRTSFVFPTWILVALTTLTIANPIRIQIPLAQGEQEFLQLEQTSAASKAEDLSSIEYFEDGAESEQEDDGEFGPEEGGYDMTWLPEWDLEEDEWIEDGWLDPRRNGGEMLDQATDDLGEPLNIIISGNSSPEVLTETGLVEFFRSIRFAPECLNQHRGRLQTANLGDGQGWIDEQYVIRQTYFPIFGTCMETLIGGNHFRAWQQNHTSAWFLAASKEIDLRGHHKIRKNGYNDGRDMVVDAVVRGSCWKGSCYTTEAGYLKGLLEPGKDGVNHGIAQDGRVAILTINVIDFDSTSTELRASLPPSSPSTSPSPVTLEMDTRRGRRARPPLRPKSEANS